MSTSVLWQGICPQLTFILALRILCGSWGSSYSPRAWVQSFSLRFVASLTVPLLLRQVKVLILTCVFLSDEAAMGLFLIADPLYAVLWRGWWFLYVAPMPVRWREYFLFVFYSSFTFPECQISFFPPAPYQLPTIFINIH